MPSRVNMCFLCYDLGISDFLPAWYGNKVILAGISVGLPLSAGCQEREAWSHQLWTGLEVAFQAL